MGPSFVVTLNTDISRVGKLLFNRPYAEAFASGSVDIPGISNYMMYVGFFHAAQSSPMIGFKTGGLIVFTGTIIAAEAPYAARTTVGIAGDTISYINGPGIMQIYGLF